MSTSSGFSLRNSPTTLLIYPALKRNILSRNGQRSVRTKLSHTSNSEVDPTCHCTILSRIRKAEPQMTLTLINATVDSLSVSWPETGGAKRYILEYRREGSQVYTTLSKKLSATEARNVFLSEDKEVGFYFRAGAVRGNRDVVDSWETHPDPFYLIAPEEEKLRLRAPTVSLGGSSKSLFVSWKVPTSFKQDSTYELQMRENVGGAVWTTVAKELRGTEALKKNLPEGHSYQFRVRSSRELNDAPFSPPSESMASRGLSSGIEQRFKNHVLLNKVNEPIPTSQALGGKEFVLLFAGADWCNPCKKYMKMLDEWYQAIAPSKRSVEIIYLSSDQDEVAFRFFFVQMPWLAIDYKDESREQLLSFANITSVPSLVVLDGVSGEIIESNVVGKTLDIERWRSIAAAQRE